MRSILFFSLLLGLFQTELSAQTTPDKIAKKTAKVVCNCINKELKGFDKDVLQAFVTMLDMEAANPGEGANYIMTLPSDMQMRFITQISKMGEGGMDACLDHSHLQAQIQKANLDMTSDDLLKLTMEQMAKISKCNAPYKLLSVGQAMESEE